MLVVVPEFHFKNVSEIPIFVGFNLYDEVRTNLAFIHVAVRTLTDSLAANHVEQIFIAGCS